jgi:hypothetical protein
VDLPHFTIEVVAGQKRKRLVEIAVMRWRPMVENGDGYFYTNPKPHFVVTVWIADENKRNVSIRCVRMTTGVVYQVAGIRSLIEAKTLAQEVAKATDWQAWDWLALEEWKR